MDDFNAGQREQAMRIERVLIAIFQQEEFRVYFVYSEEGISFRIDDSHGRILGTSYPATSIEEIKSMSDEELEKRLRELLANTQRLLRSTP